VHGALTGALQVLAAAGLALWAVANPPPWTPAARNHRGAVVPTSLGFALLVAIVAPPLLSDVVWMIRGEPGRWAADAVAVSIPAVMVYLVGLFDDRQPGRTRGWRAHLGALGRGRVTSGVAKLAVIPIASLVWVLLQPPFGVPALVDAAVIAGCANLWNLFDVAPGRSLKLGLLAAAVFLALDPSRSTASLVAVCLVLLPFDVRERAMLGDGGANLLGFLLGQLLVLRLDPSTTAAAVALGAIVALHVVADTVSFSKLIRSVPPLRWLDDLGRLPAPDRKDIPPSTGT
jgi:UDP-GlcNAc:undecaprenyl-phosphate/decaprenyl-phosphate GlcNAc-1-phosphate transferase